MSATENRPDDEIPFEDRPGFDAMTFEEFVRAQPAITPEGSLERAMQYRDEHPEDPHPDNASLGDGNLTPEEQFNNHLTRKQKPKVVKSFKDLKRMRDAIPDYLPDDL